MGRHALKKYGNPYGKHGFEGKHKRLDARRARKYGMNPYGIGNRMRFGGLARVLPIVAIGAIAIGAFAFWKKRSMFTSYKLPFFARFSKFGGIGFSNRGKLIARERIPGERIKEMDVITRKRVPYHEEVEVFEGPASFETYQGGEREYFDNSGYHGNNGLEGGETVVASSHSHGAPIVNSRRVPVRDRVKSKLMRRPVVTNYY